MKKERGFDCVCNGENMCVYHFWQVWKRSVEFAFGLIVLMVLIAYFLNT